MDGFLKPSIPLMLAFTLAACSAPLVTPNPPTFQSKVTHVSDWNAMAKRTAGRFATSHDRNTPVFVAPGPADMPFAVSYRKLLEQALLEKGFHIVETPVDGIVATASDPIVSTLSHPTILRFDVETFLYRNSDGKPVPYGTALTAASAAASQLRHIASIDTGAGIVAGAGAVFDILWSMYDTTKAEVMITDTVYDGTRLEYRDSRTIYVHPSELNFYWTRIPDSVPQTKFQPVTETSLPVR